MSEVRVRRVRESDPADLEAWVAMRHALWPDESVDAHRAEAREVLRPADDAAPTLVVFAVDEHAGAERVLGFAEWSVRAHAEGCVGDRVAYLEGWYVRADARRRRVGAALVAAGEAWGREQGCTEAASDAELDNHVSIAAHQALGFEDLGPVRLFRKTLG